MVEVSLLSIVRSGRSVPLCVHEMVSGGGTPKMEQESCKVSPRGTSTRSPRSAITSGVTGGEGEEFQKRVREGQGETKQKDCTHKTVTSIYLALSTFHDTTHACIVQQ